MVNRDKAVPMPRQPKVISIKKRFLYFFGMLERAKIVIDANDIKARHKPAKGDTVDEGNT